MFAVSGLASQVSGSQREAAGASVSRNAQLNLIGQVITGVVAFGCIPVTLGVLGLDRFGLLSLVWVLVGYFSLFGLGLGPAVTRTAAAALGAGQIDRVPAIFWTANRLQLSLGVVGAVVLAVLTPLLVDRVLHVPPSLRAEARTSLYLCAVALPFVLAWSSLCGVLQAARRFDLTNAAQVPLGVAQLALPLLCGLWWPNLAFVVSALLVSRLVGVVVLFWFATRVFPGFWSRRRFDAVEARTLFGFGGWMTVSSIISPVMVYADRFLLGYFRSMAAVSYYSVPSDAAMRLLIIPGSLVGALFPVFSSSTDSADRGRLAVRGLKFVLILVGVPAVALIALASDLMTLWMGRDFAARSSVPFQILLAGVVCNALAHVPSSLTQSTGRADLTAAIHIVELPAYLALAYVGIRHWGASGAAAAWSIRAAGDLIALLWMSRRSAGLSIREVIRQRLPAMALTLAGCTLLGMAAAHNLQVVVWRVLAAAVVCGLGAAVSWGVCLSADDRQRFYGLARELRR